MANHPVDLTPVIELENISVCYRVPEERINTFKEYTIRLLQNKVKSHDFLALQSVFLSVGRGETLGIIGANGAGKSTLLKVVARVLVPTVGRVRVVGQVSPLLELGAGFHPELTGRENIFLNGTLLGHSRREIADHLDEVLDFAQLDGFVDAPLRTYSSGMVARLGFSVATSWEPEILLLDETLAVGDEAFRAKCISRLEGFRDRGTTTLLVSHDPSLVQARCNRVALLDKGHLKAIGSAEEIIRLYHQEFLN
jgi:ABC-type polysaccharide/polyol phosphate transport system ATPase subunit